VEKAKCIASEMPMEDKPLFTLLSSFIQKRFGLVIPATLWSDKDLPDHLKMRISIRDDKGKEIKAIRDKAVLNEFLSTSPQKSNAVTLARKKHEQTNIKEWNFKDLEEFIIIDQGREFTQKGYLGLKIETRPGTDMKNKSLALRLFTSPEDALTSHCQGIKMLFQICFPDDFKSLKKDIASNPEIKRIAPFFKSPAKFQTALFDRITTTLFAKNIRTQKDFNTHAQKELGRLYAFGQAFIKIILDLGKEYQACFELIQKLSFQHQDKKKIFNTLTDLFNDLKNLVPQNFADLYPYERIEHLHRYVACIRIRAQRSVDNPIKEEKKAVKLLSYNRHLNSLLSSLSQNTSSEKSRQVEAFFWLLEEYKISLFAPELKTAIKVSAKKLDQVLTRISTMI
ncbi:MAG: DUF3418 domain-containing protein, partial [Proteobacteria bacterium]|nr:DUF3418 domain-containing protein [Pseudomonadota bacterium]